MISLPGGILPPGIGMFLLKALSNRERFSKEKSKERMYLI